MAHPMAQNEKATSNVELSLVRDFLLLDVANIRNTCTY